MKQISLRAVVLVQALLALCIPLYYILMVQLRLRSTAAEGGLAGSSPAPPLGTKERTGIGFPRPLGG